MRRNTGRSKGMKKCFLVLFFLLLAYAGHASEAVTPDGSFNLTILHVNDTHSHLDPSIVDYSCRNRDYRAELGGFARLAKAVKDLRRQERHSLFLHGGDMVQGTLYFTKYEGRADVDLFNAMGLDAATLGNHDFDRGAEAVAKLADAAVFPLISANVNTSKAPVLGGKIRPYVIRTFDGHPVAVIGATTTSAPAVSSPGGLVSFERIIPRIAEVVRELREKGIDKIILLTHIGYHEDLRLARTVPGIDVIVGGHSHTLLGQPAGPQGRDTRYGMPFQPEGDYPTVVRGPDGGTVLIVQAWEWGKVLGYLDVTFDEGGKITSWKGRPMIVVGDVRPKKGDQSGNVAVAGTAIDGADVCLPAWPVRFAEDPAIRDRLARYREPLEGITHVRLATALKPIRRGLKGGPGALVAESLLWKTRHLKTEVALQNMGGIRCDIPAGDITARTVYELLPFGNTLYILDLKGYQLRDTLEEIIQNRIQGNRTPGVHAAGVQFKIDSRASFGNRVLELKIRKGNRFVPVKPANTYRLVVQNYLARGGDGCKTLKRIFRFGYDTGFVDALVFMEYLRQMPGGVVIEPPVSVTLLKD